MSLSFNPQVVPDNPAPAEAIVGNDGFFPDIDPADLRRDARILDAVTAPRLRSAILAAIIAVGLSLESWKQARIAEGRASLAAVPALQLDGRSRLLVLYDRAIAAHVKAELIERNRDTDLTGAGQRRVEELDPAIGDLRRDAIHAVRDFLAQTRTCVELI